MRQPDATLPRGTDAPGDADADSASIALRPIAPEDERFLCAVYASTRADELALVDWDERQKKTFVRMQFTAQHRYYQEHYADATFQVILCDGVPAGRLYVARWPDEIRIVDIALLPTYRNRGIGSFLLRQLLAEAAQASERVSIHVERFNPALRLYTRLGFRSVADRGVYLLMEWAPGAVPAQPGPQPVT
jgi:ribosomal protein S18 acetylase RimI-like enzyme